MDNYELYHYGIKGQRWGIRRFQKKNGSLTSVGKKRYAVADKETGDVVATMPKKGWVKTPSDPNNVSYYKVTRKGSAASDKIPQNATKAQIKNAKKQVNQRLKENTRNWSDDANEASKIKKKGVKEMSNAELRRLNERVRLEQEYSRLNPSAVKKGLAAVTATAATMGTLLNLYNNSDKLVTKGKPIVEKLINPAIDKAKKTMAIGLY